VKSKSDNIVRTFVNATMYPEHNNNTVSRWEEWGLQSCQAIFLKYDFLAAEVLWVIHLWV
jgi:hypothetical protein